MLAHGLPANSFTEYLKILEGSSGEYKELLNVFSVNVTQFFRDLSLWKVLYKNFLPQLLREKKQERFPSLKIWSCACSTGEEPYSIAILLKELLTPQVKNLSVRIIATDIDTDAIRKARAGLYTGRELANVEKMAPEWLKKYFSPLPGGNSGPGQAMSAAADSQPQYQISGEIQKLVAFEAHNFFLDGHQTGLDMVFCRNAIIYLNAKAKIELVERFYNSLAHRGLLVLGRSELIFADKGGYWFRSVDDAEHIYRKEKGG